MLVALFDGSGAVNGRRLIDEFSLTLVELVGRHSDSFIAFASLDEGNAWRPH